MSLERTILRNLLHNEEYITKVIPFLKTEYFHDTSEALIFDILTGYYEKYSRTPTLESLGIDLSNKEGITQEVFNRATAICEDISRPTDSNLQWLLDNTEKFCQDKALFNALRKSIAIIDKDGEKGVAVGSIPKIMEEALSVSFDAYIGHNYIEDSEKRFEFYHRIENKIPFSIDKLNEVTQGGLSNKTLTIFLAGCVHPETKVKIRFRKKTYKNP